ncbi:MAG: capsular biosynthesis protein [Rhodospirillaceae bacterium]|nr:capsular biosynthesis protein [Rhodospirillaceae bacterium]
MRSFLFLQGPPALFFWRLGKVLEGEGHRVTRINLCIGDHLSWPRLGARNYRGSAARWPDYLARVLAERGVTDVLMSGEQRPLHKAALPVIKAHGANVVVTDFGYLRPDWITLERDGMSGLSRFPRDPEAIRALAARVGPPDLDLRFRDSLPKMALWEITTDVLNWFYWVFFPHYRSHLLVNPARLYLSGVWRDRSRARRNRAARTDLAVLKKSRRPYFVFPLQMEVDFQIRAYSPYRGLKEAIVEVLDSFARAAPPEVCLAVKTHPFDQGVTPWDRVVKALAAERGLGDRVVMLDGGTLKALLARTRGIVTINSTFGIWAIRERRPVHVLGTAVYDVPGLTHQGDLDSFWQAPPPPDRDLADAWVRAAAGTIQVRGTYYSRDGLEHAVRESAYRLIHGLVGEPLRAEDRAALARIKV